MSDRTDSFLTVREVAATLQLSPRTIHRLVDAEALAAVKVGRSVRISPEALQEFLRRDGKPDANAVSGAELAAVVREVRLLRERIEELMTMIEARI